MVDTFVRALPQKLRLTAVLLGCTSQKDLCAAFRRVNPVTDFDLERSYKWMQGRALPRSARVYEDWLSLLGTVDKSVSWLMAVPVEEFAETLALLKGQEPSLLLRQAGLSVTAPASEPGTNVGPDGYLCGVYASYSHAQSPYYAGRLVRGTLVIDPAGRRAEGLVAVYSQTLSVGRVQAAGSVGLYGASMCLELRLPAPGVAPIFFSLFRPSPPASVLAGVLCGTTFVHPAGQPPYATRVVLVRIAASPADVEASNRYLGQEDAPVTSDLGALGMAVGLRRDFEAKVRRILYPDESRIGSDQLVATDYADLAMMCDQVWLNGPLAAGDRS